ncbi:hypothetical protein [Xanthomonas theicola]|nr:hypothetical protein [Xanthomonas theicola]QNH23709.1 hypothetical protein G4Q83_01500 [Xanthomonas theicola]
MSAERTSLSLALALALLVGAAPLGAAPAAAAAAGRHLPAAHTAWAQAWQQWRQGDARAALATVEAGLRDSPEAAGLQLRAALLDAGGDLAAAQQAYAAAALASQGAPRWTLQVHAALLAKDPAPALAALELAGPARQRMAVLLAMLGRTDLALSAASAGSGVVVDLQRAAWALQSGDASRARTHAWRAFDAAADAGDRRYALALWMEAWRDAQQMEQAVQWLQRQPPQPELQQALVDALLELGRFDEAIAQVKRSQDPAMRQRLIGILELAGRSEEVASEYRGEIRRQPHAAAAYIGLAAQELAAGRRPQALATFAQLFAANRGRAEVLLPAARQMTAMGLQDQAMPLLRAAALPAAARGAVDLYAFDGLLAGGDDAAAGRLLAALHARLPAADPLQSEVADGFERLQQPAQALAVLLAMERARAQPLDYDLQVRIATLAMVAGDSQQALARWRALWTQAQLPARRAFLERQIVKVARARGELEPLAAALEAQQAQGTLPAAGLDLLVALALALEAPERAEAAVARQARARGGGGRTAQLRQLGGLYARLGDGARVDGVLRELVKADPDNAAIYLRKLALNTARGPRAGAGAGDEAARLQALQAILAQLQARETDAGQSVQYAAGLYAIAGLDDAAAAAYERAMVLAPDGLDNLLQLAELRKRQQRVPEAVALLQAAAAASGSQARFIQLADAIGGLLVADPDAPTRRGDPREALAPVVNAWLQRQLLARLGTDADAYPLYAVLADLGQAQADFPLQLRAYDNALAAAGEQRGLLLRQLVTLLSGSNGSDGQAGASIGDNARKLRYGRRLLALKREFPPDFFADLGRSLLAGGDALGAERAFAAMSDLGGLVNVAQFKGDSYASQGRVEQALINYSQALARDQDNPELILKTSILRERRDDDGQANHWYWHGLRALLLRQPLQDNGLVNDVALDSQRFQPALLEGLLLTWHDDAPEAIAAWRALQDLWNQTLALADPSVPFARQARLRALLSLQQQLGAYRGDDAAVARAEDAVIARFSADPAVREAIQTRRLRAGRGPQTAADSTGAWVRAGLSEQAERSGNASLALATSGNDQARVHALVADAIAAEAAWQAANAGQAQASPGPDTLYVLLAQGAEQLPREQFLQQVYAPIAAAPFRAQVLFNVYRGAPDQYALLEKRVGHALLDDATLMRLLVEQANQPIPFTVRKRASEQEYGERLVGRFDTAQRLTLLERFDAAAQAGKGRSMLQATLVEDLLRKPLSGEQRTRLSRVVAAQIDHPLDFEQGSAAFAIIPLLVLDADEGNRPLLQEAAARIARRHPDGRRFPGFLRAWFDGDRTRALGELQALSADTGQAAGDYAQALVSKWFPEQRQQRIDAFFADPAPDPATTAAFHREFVLDAGYGDDAPAPRATTRYLERLVAVEPANPGYLAGLLEDDLKHARQAQYLQRLQAYVDANPDQSIAAAALVLDLYAANQDDAARRVETATGLDSENTDAMLDLINKARAQLQQAQGPDLNALLEAAFGRFQQARPQAALSQAVIRQGQAAAALADDDGQRGGSVALARTHASAPAQVRQVLRGLWRNAPPATRLALLSQPYDSDGHLRGTPMSKANDGPDLLPAIAADPGVAQELDLYLRAMPTAQRQRAQPLYALIASGLQATGGLPARATELRARLREGALDGHGVQLLATLLAQQGSGLDDAGLQALRQTLARMPLLAPAQRVLFAQVFAQSGATGEATLLIQAATQQLLHPSSGGGDDEILFQSPQEALEALAESLGRWPDRDAALASWRWLEASIGQEAAQQQAGIRDFKRPGWL